MKVRRLPDDVVDRIAAGEVVERPASALKELVENSLDAGATRVQVEIAGGGRNLDVVDDGSGMSEEDLLLALERHATSKLGSVEDLWRIETLGFRGEALPSLAAVSRLEIRTRSPGEAVGHRVLVEGGHRRLVAEVAHAPGTEVLVRDLFYNTPARLEFLKRPETEVARAVEAAERLALARPEVAFTVRVDGRLAFRTGGTGNRLDALTDLWGVELAARLLAAQGQEGEVRVHLLLGPAGEGRPSRSHQHVFVNGRPVQVPRLRHALEEAYRERLLKGRFPVFCLDLRLPPAAVDPNVHPQKLEVRLREEQRVAGLVHRVARAALAPSWPSASAKPRVEPELGKAPEQLSVAEPTWAYAAEPFGRAEAAAGQEPQNRTPPEPVGVVAGLYVVAAGEEGMYIVDQHAAHERVRYERLEAAAREAQALVSPLVVHLSAAEMAAVAGRLTDLASVGMAAEPIGPQEVAVRAVPVALGRELGLEDVRRVLAELAREERPDPAALRRALVACRGSVKAHDALSLPEVSALIASLWACREPRHCPHGRPTFLYFPFAELEVRFGRR